MIAAGMVEAMRSEDISVLEAFLARELPSVLEPGLPEDAEATMRSLVSTLTRLIWNATPLRSEGFRPRPVKAPERNDPCPCGSGQKFKKCCDRASHAFPVIGADEAWSTIASQLDAREAERILRAEGLPLLALEPLSERLEELDTRRKPCACCAEHWRLRRHSTIDTKASCCSRWIWSSSTTGLRRHWSLPRICCPSCRAPCVVASTSASRRPRPMRATSTARGPCWTRRDRRRPTAPIWVTSRCR